MLRRRAIQALRPLLPTGSRRAAALRRADRAIVDPVETWRYRRRSGETRPLPPRAIRERNAVDDVGYWYTAVDEAAGPLHTLLERHGVRLAALDRVLDFGCGAGKVIASLRGSGPELHGCDIHGPSIAWLRRTYPDLRLVHNDFDPPLPHADAHFDLVWAWSVLTHLDADRQRAWIAEWARIVRPRGHLLATFNAPAQLERTYAQEGREGIGASLGRLDREGVLFERYDMSGNFAADFSGTTEAYGNTYNTPASIEALVHERFEVLEIAPDAVWGNQHCVVARRR